MLPPFELSALKADLIIEHDTKSYLCYLDRGQARNIIGDALLETKPCWRIELIYKSTPQSQESTYIDKGQVELYRDLYYEHPAPEVGWAVRVMVELEGDIVRYDGTTWVNTGLKEMPQSTEDGSVRYRRLFPNGSKDFRFAPADISQYTFKYP